MKSDYLILSVALLLSATGLAQDRRADILLDQPDPDRAGRKLSQELDDRSELGLPAGDSIDDNAQELDVIVQYFSTPGEADVNRAHMAGARLRGIGRETRHGLFRMTKRQAVSLAQDPNVAYVTPDREVRTSGLLDQSIATVGATIAQTYGYDGRGIGVAVIDSGVASEQADLKNSACATSRVVYSEDLVTWEPNGWDPYGHGTHVAGIIGGNGICTAKQQGTAYKGLPGIAPQVNLVSLRALDSKGVGKDSSVIAAIDRAIALKKTYNIRVMNLSLGRIVKESYKLDPLCQAVERAWKAGIVVVVAAGNNGRDNSKNTSGYSTITSPGNDPFVITVGAMRDMKTPSKGDDQISTFSSKGPTLIDQYVKPDLMAPGNMVTSLKPFGTYLQNTYPQNTIAGAWDTGVPYDAYFILSGTSMATPMVSGAAALLLQKDPSLTPDQVKARLMKTATKNFPSTSTWTDPKTRKIYQANADIFTVGAGYLDIWAALSNGEKIASNQSAKSPKVVLKDGNVVLVNDSSNTGGMSVIWGANVIWGSSVVWGSNVVVSGSSVVWGSNVVWGASSMQGFSVIWGSSVVWGAANPFSEATAVVGEP